MRAEVLRQSRQYRLPHIVEDIDADSTGRNHTSSGQGVVCTGQGGDGLQGGNYESRIHDLGL